MDLSADLVGAWRTRQAHFPLEIAFYYPNRTVAISLTGVHCALNCAHCGGHYLEGMQPVEIAAEQAATGKGTAARAKRCLISGGCDHDGRVPVRAKLEAVKRLRPGRRFNWHVGLIGQDDMEAIAPYVDTISFDFVGDDATIREVYGLDRPAADYAETYRALVSRFSVIPHVTIGLRGGEIAGEPEALGMLGELGLESLVFIVFTPTPGTRYADRRAPDLPRVAELLVEAREMFPDKPLIMGCMRPGGLYRVELDCLAVKAGLNGIVNPAPAAVRLARQFGLEVLRGEECCVL